jgi:hypothetical protein
MTIRLIQQIKEEIKMTKEMRERVLNSIENGDWSIEKAQRAIEHEKKVINYWEEKSLCYEAKYKINQSNADIKYYEAIIEVLTEMQEIEIANEAIQTVVVLVKTVVNSSKSKVIRKAVATMANKLRKLNYSLSNAFKKACIFIKSFTSLFPSWA